jgi:hypothetical protein
MIWNKLARWASVAAFSTIVPAAAMATSHHSRLTHPTTAPSSLTSRHVKATAGKKAIASKLMARGIKTKQLKTTKHKSAGLKSKKTTTSKLVGKKHVASKLTTSRHAVSKLAAKKHVASKLTSAKARALASHKATIKHLMKAKTPVAPTM